MLPVQQTPNPDTEPFTKRAERSARCGAGGVVGLDGDGPGCLSKGWPGPRCIGSLDLG